MYDDVTLCMMTSEEVNKKKKGYAWGSEQKKQVTPETAAKLDKLFRNNREVFQLSPKP
jgi:hypothetical protein